MSAFDRHDRKTDQRTKQRAHYGPLGTVGIPGTLLLFSNELRLLLLLLLLLPLLL
jgi:hypothetical protein